MTVLDTTTDCREPLSVVVLGAQGSGKSTIVGHLRHQCGLVSQDALDAVTQESADAGKPTLRFAWLSDTRRSARERGLTVDTADGRLCTSKYEVNLIDTPGHRAYIKHAIAGAASADHALLVVDARDGAFEATMSEVTEQGASSTKELALVAFVMGIRELIVVVNEMDQVAYAQTRFDAIRDAFSVHLVAIGFQRERVQFVPVSGWLGENLAFDSSHMPWNAGSATLLSAIDQLSLPTRAIDLPLRMSVLHAYFQDDGTTVIVTGRIQTGVVRRGAQVAVGARGLRGTVSSIESHGRALPVGYAGMTVGLQIRDLSAKQLAVARGDVVSDPSWDEARPVTRFTARLVFLAAPAKSSASRATLDGYAPTVYCHTARVRCHAIRIAARVDRRTGLTEVSSTQETTQNAKAVCAGDACDVVFRVTSSAVEAFREYAPLGRIVVRDHGTTVAVGVVRAVERDGAWRP